MELLQEHLVPTGTARIRLSDYLHLAFALIPSRKGGKKAIQRGLVMVNGEPASSAIWVKPGMRIELYRTVISPPKPFPLKIQVLYQDDFLAIVNKPSGIPVSGNHFRTLTNALVDQLSVSAQPDALQWAMPVHRLDAPTSGIVVFAKTSEAQVQLGKDFQARRLTKYYQAIVCGRTEASGDISIPLDGKKAMTRFKKLEECRSPNCEWITLLELTLHTGRTHQLRRHLAHMGTPILGDSEYTPPEQPLLRNKGLFLHATAISVPHPCAVGTININTPLPGKFMRIMEQSEKRFSDL